MNEDIVFYIDNFLEWFHSYQISLAEQNQPDESVTYVGRYLISRMKKMPNYVPMPHAMFMSHRTECCFLANSDELFRCPINFTVDDS